MLGDLDRETLKELGIKSVGKQLELLKQIKSLFRKKSLFSFLKSFDKHFLELQILTKWFVLVNIFFNVLLVSQDYVY